MRHLLVTGGRDWGLRLSEFCLLYEAIELLQPTLVIEGAARGADDAGYECAWFQGIEVRSFHADWTKHGRSAGPIRNGQMLKEGLPHAVLACPGGRGTADMVKQARARGVPVWELTSMKREDAQRRARSAWDSWTEEDRLTETQTWKQL